MRVKFVRTCIFISTCIFVVGFLSFRSSWLIESVSAQSPDPTPSKKPATIKATPAAKPPPSKRKPVIVRPAPKATDDEVAEDTKPKPDPVVARIQEALDHGNKALELRQYEQALNAFRQATSLDSKEAKAYF